MIPNRPERSWSARCATAQALDRMARAARNDGDDAEAEALRRRAEAIMIETCATEEPPILKFIREHTPPYE